MIIHHIPWVNHENAHVICKNPHTWFNLNYILILLVKV